MQQFIQMATSALGTSEQVARTLAGGLLDVVARSAPQADVSALLGRLPGAADLLNAFRTNPPAPPAPPPDPGLLGSLSGAAATVLGAGASVLGTGSAGLAALGSLLGQHGVDASKAPQLMAMFAQWASQHAGADLVQRVLGSVPGASTLLAGLAGFTAKK
jgi:hypothetical protein